MQYLRFISQFKSLSHSIYLIGMVSSGIVLMPQLAIALAAPAPSIQLDSVNLDPIPAAAPANSANPDPIAPLQVQSAEVFIDKTDYSLGATQPIDPELVPATRPTSRNYPATAEDVPSTPAPAQISLGNNVGSIQLSAAGVGWSPSPEEPSESTVTPATPAYLNRKLLRPFSRFSNTNLKLIYPLAIPAPITSLFGWRTHPITGDTRVHTGTDIGAPLGTPVVAAMAGRVLLADFLGGYGMTIAIEYQDGTQQTLYGHLSEIFVKPGELIQQGAVIGRVGSTGNSTGPHLHFELRGLTDAGWMAMDSGEYLERSMGDLVSLLKVSGTQPEPQVMFKNLPTKSPVSTSKPLQMLRP
jgi:murein DD-endopeptidase MepM/ murein hydrolase activator NlpD